MRGSRYVSPLPNEMEVLRLALDMQTKIELGKYPRTQIMPTRRGFPRT
jgi:hypothetical protein